MKIINLLLLFILLCCAQLPQKRADTKLSILQGVTNYKEVEFSVLAPKDQPLEFELRNAAGEVLKPEEIRVIARPHSPYVIHKTLFTRDPKHSFNLYVYSEQKLIDQRLVGTGQLESQKLKIAVLSCINDELKEHFKIWDVLASKNPEYILMIGDNVYADRSPRGGIIKVTPETLWNRYVDVRLNIPFYYQQKLIPVHALWDDHDYGMNDGNETFEFKNESKDIFEAFFGQDIAQENWTKGHGVGGKLSLGDFNLYFLDARSFRSPNPEGRHLGIDQKDWLTSSLKEEATPSFIIKGDQFFGGYHSFESYEGNHAKEFSQFVNELKSLNAPFVFLSGDRHLSEIMQFPRSLFGKPSFEITSSPMHAKVFVDQNTNNPWRVVSEHKHMNFTLIESLAKENHWFMDVENIGEDGQVFYRRELAVYIKDLQYNLDEIRKKRRGRRNYRRRGRR